MSVSESQQRLVEWLCLLQEDLKASSHPIKITDLSSSKGVPLEVVTLGVGTHGSAVLYRDTEGVFGKDAFGKPVSIVLKVHEDGATVDNVAEHEIYVGLLLSRLCRGSTLAIHQVSPHVVRIFGSMDAVWFEGGEGQTSRKLVRRAMVMEPIHSPFEAHNLKDLLYGMRQSGPAWKAGWIRVILLQVIYTLAVWGPRFRHNDLTPANIAIQALPEEVQKEGYAYALQLDEESIVYFYTNTTHVLPFEVKIIDFGMAMDLGSPHRYGLPKLNGQARKMLGIDLQPSSYFDLYSFLHTTYALSGFLPSLETVDVDGKPVKEAIFPPSAPAPLDPKDHPEVQAFIDFMERHKIAQMPRVSSDTVVSATGAKRLIRQWLPSAIQAKAEAGKGEAVDDYGKRFVFLTPAQILQDPYFDPLRVDGTSFAKVNIQNKFYAPLGASWNKTLAVNSVAACPSTPSSSTLCTSLDGQAFDASLSQPLQMGLQI